MTLLVALGYIGATVLAIVGLIALVGQLRLSWVLRRNNRWKHEL